MAASSAEKMEKEFRNRYEWMISSTRKAQATLLVEVGYSLIISLERKIRLCGEFFENCARSKRNDTGGNFQGGVLMKIGARG